MKLSDEILMLKILPSIPYQLAIGISALEGKNAKGGILLCTCCRPSLHTKPNFNSNSILHYRTPWPLAAYHYCFI